MSRMPKYAVAQFLPESATQHPELVQSAAESAAIVALTQAMRAGHTLVSINVDNQPIRTSAGVEIRATATARPCPADDG